MCVGSWVSVRLASTCGKKKYGKLGTTEIREMRQLRDENAPLKRLVAELTLDKHILGGNRPAIGERAVVIHYQPQIALATGRVESVEALFRLAHPRLGIVYPDQFIKETEQLGLMDALTDIVMERALEEIAALEGLAEATLSINFPASSLVDLALPERIAKGAALANIPLSRLVIEITESGLIKEFGKALDVLARMRLRNSGVSIDDFGTGYSSMAQLRRVPCTELKIDRSFVKDMLVDESAMAVVEESIGLAHRLRLRVVAEGVETAQQARALGPRRLQSRPRVLLFSSSLCQRLDYLVSNSCH
jgi:EAL domain-containing protein (putative c-di-GMP-specific phosphodiesterase class I)